MSEQEELIELSHPSTGKSIFVNLKSNTCYSEFPSSAKLYDCCLQFSFVSDANLLLFLLFLFRVERNDNGQEWWELMDTDKKVVRFPVIGNAGLTVSTYVLVLL